MEEQETIEQCPYCSSKNVVYWKDKDGENGEEVPEFTLLD